MRLHLNYKEIEKYEEPFTAVVDRGNGLEIWNYKTGTDAEKHKRWLYKKGIPTSYVELFDNTREAEDTYPEAETHGEQVKAGRNKTKEEQKKKEEYCVTIRKETSKQIEMISSIIGITPEEVIEKIVEKGITIYD